MSECVCDVMCVCVCVSFAACHGNLLLITRYCDMVITTYYLSLLQIPINNIYLSLARYHFLLLILYSYLFPPVLLRIAYFV